eukprot:TRINITY_DN3415_c0_g2_i2.p1 TRINITY_DN3415_c0_g2~~TRINITY_DN3415_c0_g2_i2.p1  ORF type:complete len:597 (-),score=84.55 TRINITY_DN3415_c0_g2_i2:85-1806(-)
MRMANTAAAFVMKSLVCILFLFSSSPTSHVVSGQESALIYGILYDFWQSTGGSGWTFDRWDFSDSTPYAYCDWPGIRCVSARDHNVAAIVLNDNNLQGKLTASLGSLGPAFETLSLGNNQLTSGLPVELGRLTGLRSLLLNNNQLCGTISNIVTTLSLISLDLSRNNFVGSVPVFTQAATFEVINLSNNYLIGNLPTTLGPSWGRLQVWNVAYNHLTGTIPASYGNIPSINEITMHHNQLSQSIPTSFDSKNFDIYLQYNLFQGSAPIFIDQAVGGAAILWNISCNSYAAGTFGQRQCVNSICKYMSSCPPDTYQNQQAPSTCPPLPSSSATTNAHITSTAAYSSSTTNAAQSATFAAGSVASTTNMVSTTAAQRATTQAAANYAVTTSNAAAQGSVQAVNSQYATTSRAQAAYLTTTSQAYYRLTSTYAANGNGVTNSGPTTGGTRTTVATTAAGPTNSGTQQVTSTGGSPTTGGGSGPATTTAGPSYVATSVVTSGLTGGSLTAGTLTGATMVVTVGASSTRTSGGSGQPNGGPNGGGTTTGAVNGAESFMSPSNGAMLILTLIPAVAINL